jgi:hypothetical protein
MAGITGELMITPICIVGGDNDTVLCCVYMCRCLENGDGFARTMLRRTNDQGHVTGVHILCAKNVVLNVYIQIDPI